MTAQIQISPVIRETFRGGAQLLVTIWPWLLIYSLVKALAGFASSMGGTVLSVVMFAVVLGASCAWAIAMYRQLLPVSSTASFKSSSFSLFVAAFLVFLLFAVIIFIAGLFLVITSALLVIASGYDPSTGDAENVTASVEALRASGGIWLIYIFSALSFGLFIWFGLRLFLYGVVTAVQGKIIVFQSWPLTKGHAIKIGLLCALLIGLPFLAAMIASETTAGWLGLPIHWSLAAGFVAEPTSGAVSGQWQQALHGFLSGLYHAPAILLGHSLVAAIYRRLGPLEIAEVRVAD